MQKVHDFPTTIVTRCGERTVIIVFGVDGRNTDP
jgi:hypothetical protein